MKTKFVIFLLLFFINQKAYTQPKVRNSPTQLTSAPTRDTFKDSFELKSKEKETDMVRIYVQQPSLSENIFKDILPVLTLLLGIILNRAYDFFQERCKIKKAGKRWISEIEFLKNPIDFQLKAFDTFITKFKPKKFVIPDMDIAQGLDCEIFKSLDQNDLRKYFELKKPTEVPRITYKAIGITKNIAYYNSILVDRYEELRKEISNFSSELSVTLQAMGKAFANYQRFNEQRGYTEDSRTLLDNMWALFVNEIEPYKQKGNFDPFRLKENFFIPLARLLSDYRLEESIENIEEVTHKALNLIKKFEFDKQNLIEVIQKLKSNFQEEKIILDEFISEIKEK